MKKTTLLLFAGMFFLTVTAMAGEKKEYNPGAKVSELFKKDFPDATNITWEKRVSDVNVVHFNLFGKNQDAYYTEDGDLLGQGWYINVSEAPDFVKTAAVTKQKGEIKTVYLFLSPEDFPVYYARMAAGTKEVSVRINSYGEASKVWKKKRTGLFN